jgi:hypothetical protein
MTWLASSGPHRTVQHGAAMIYYLISQPTLIYGDSGGPLYRSVWRQVTATIVDWLLTLNTLRQR